MKKLFLVLMLATLMCLTLAVAVSAEAYAYDFGEVEHIDYFEKYAETNGKDYISVAMQNPQATSKESRICVSCSCEKGKHTYPTYYFMSINPALTTLFNRDYQAINDNNPCGMTYGNNNILAVEVPEGCADFWGDRTDKGTFYQHTSLVYVKIPLSLSNLSVNAFKGCTALEWVDFGENNKIKTLGNSTFNGCTSLKGVCLPDSITYMNNATFIGCLNLGPVHLPDSLISFGDTPQWSTFQGGESGNGSKCTKLFLTNERFDNPDEVEKPDVYYMPSNFTSCGDQLFRGCSNINSVIVFPTTYKAVGDFRSFIGYGGTADNPKTVIFLGDMSDFKGYADKTSSYMNFVFANPNDTVGNFNPTFTFDGSHADIIMYSCASGQAGRAYQTSWSSDLFKHFVDVRKSEEITHGNCTEAGTIQAYCFCGAEMGVVNGTTDPNAHEFDTDKNAIVVGVQYVSFDKDGTRTIKCARCTETSTDNGATPIITTKGYSVKNDGTGIDGGYIINLGALELYESLVSNAKIGIIIANAENVGSLTKVENGEYVLATEKGIMVELSSREYSSFNMALNGFTPESASNLNLVICAYVIADYDNDSETANTIKYIQHGIDSSEDEFVEVTPGVSLYTLTLEKIKAYLSKKD